MLALLRAAARDPAAAAAAAAAAAKKPAAGARQSGSGAAVQQLLQPGAREALRLLLDCRVAPYPAGELAADLAGVVLRRRSLFLGVAFHASCTYSWYAYVRGRLLAERRIGSYDRSQEAAAAADLTHLVLHGPRGDGRLNFPASTYSVAEVEAWRAALAEAWPDLPQAAAAAAR